MGLVSEAFSELDEQLKLSPATHEQAKRIRGQLDTTLKDAGLEASSLIQGSYGRKTMRPPLKDLDLVILATAQGGQGPDGDWDVHSYVDRLKGALVSSGDFAGVSFDEDGVSAHALQLTLPGVDFTVDLVPARESSEPGWLLLGDRETGEWNYPSDVRALRDKVAKRNQDCSGRWVRQVRMSKATLSGDEKINKLVCGFLVESAAYDVVTDKMSDQKAVAVTLARIAEATQGPYFGLGQRDLTRKWTDEERAFVVSYFADSAAIAKAALDAEKGYHEQEAVRLWSQVIPAIPAPRVSFDDRLAQVATVGGGSSALGVLTTQGSQIRPSRPWRRA